MKKLLFSTLLMILTVMFTMAQDRVIADFEDGDPVFNIEGTSMPAEIVDNPNASGINISSKVLKVTSKADWNEELSCYPNPVINFYTHPVFSFKAYCKDTISLSVRFDNPDRWQQYMVSNEFPFTDPTKWTIKGDSLSTWIEFQYDLGKWDNLSGYNELFKIMTVARITDSVFYIDDVKMIERDPVFTSSSIVPLFYDPVSPISWVGDWAGGVSAETFEYRVAKSGYTMLATDTLTLSKNWYDNPVFPADVRLGSSGAPSYILTGAGTRSASLTFPIPTSGATNKTFKFGTIIMGNGSYSTEITPLVEYATEFMGDDTEWTTLTITGVPDADSTWTTVSASIDGVSDFTYIRVSNTTTATDTIQIWIDDITLEGSITLSESIDVTAQDNLTEVCIGGTVQMLLNQMPEAASSVGKWYTSDTTGVIDNQGVLTGMYHADTIWVYGETVDGSGLIDSAKIFVVEDAILSESVDVTSDKSALTSTDQFAQLTAIVKPVNVLDKTVSWSVDNTDLASITQDGLLRAKADGTVIVTATANDANASTGTISISISGFTSGITTPKIQKIGFYPNPVVDVVNLKADFDIQSISILSLDGRTVSTFNSNNKRLDVSDLNAGVYILKVVSADKAVYQSKLVKE